MDKIEFLNRLRAALTGRVDATVLAENLAYYEDYINSQMRMGRTEEEVLQSLGDPRLIAKTIIETNEPDGSAVQEGKNNYREDDDRNTAGRYVIRHSRLPVGAWLVIVIVVLIVILVVLFSLLSFLVPFLLPVLVVAFMIKLFRDWLN